MASLKDYLRNFAKASSRFAFPTKQKITVGKITSSTNAGRRDYVPPCDGYLVVWATGTAIETYATSQYVEQLSTNPSGTVGRAFCPCAKGDVASWGVWGSSFTDGEVYFVPSLGSQ